MQAKRVKIKVLYEGKNITEDVTRNLISLTYTDKMEGQCDELEIRVEDTDGKWRNEWYPEKGAKITAYIGYDDALVLCGTFEIDKVNVSGPPAELTFSCLSAGITKSLRTKNSQAFENITLKQLAEKVAKANGLKLVGTIQDIKLLRVTQNRETDLGFLKRIADEYGYIFNVRDSQLIFSNILDTNKRNAVRTIDMKDLISYDMEDTTAHTFKEAKLVHHNPNTKKVVKGSNDAIKVDKLYNKDGVSYTQIRKSDTLEIRTKAETGQQAEIKSQVYLYRANSKQMKGNLSLEGNPLLVAGNNIELTGLGIQSGVYNIEQSTHTVDKSGGYTTSLEVKRVGFVDFVKHKSTKKKKKPKTYDLKVTN